MTNWEKLYREATDERDTLREQVKLLEEALGAKMPGPSFVHLTTHESRLFGALRSTAFMTKEAILNVMYGGMLEEPNQKIIDVYICKIRRKMAPFGVEIDTVWGRGYCISDVMKARINLLEAECQQALFQQSKPVAA